MPPIWPLFAVPNRQPWPNHRQDRLSNLEHRMNEFLAEKRNAPCDDALLDRVKASREEVRSARTRAR